MATGSDPGVATGKDVVVQAPTGSGKTYIFELFYPDLKEQAVFTVPTRTLANDKLAEWRARGVECLLHRIVTKPPYPLPRWNELKRAAGKFIEKTVPPTIVDRAGLRPVQQRGVS